MIFHHLELISTSQALLKGNIEYFIGMLLKSPVWEFASKISVDLHFKSSLCKYVILLFYYKFNDRICSITKLEITVRVLRLLTIFEKKVLEKICVVSSLPTIVSFLYSNVFFWEYNILSDKNGFIIFHIVIHWIILSFFVEFIEIVWLWFL